MIATFTFVFAVFPAPIVSIWNRLYLSPEIVWDLIYGVTASCASNVNNWSSNKVTLDDVFVPSVTLWFLNKPYTYAPLAPIADVPNVDSISFVSWESTDDVPAKFVEPVTLIIKSPLDNVVNDEPLNPVVSVFLSVGNKIPTDADTEPVVIVNSKGFCTVYPPIPATLQIVAVPASLN